jgi:dienelactone hydrolase
VAARFDPTMAAVLSPAKLAATWDSVLEQAGPLRAVAGARHERAGTFNVVFVTCQFERLTLDVKLAFDARRHIAGMFFVPTTANPAAAGAPPLAGTAPAAGTPAAPGTAAAAPAWTPPAYAAPAAFHERQVTVGSAPWELPGTLTLPNGVARCPVVILVHGSGPTDQDETIGPNKPFKDLAWGLASRGVAVLRYTKRTAQYGAQLKLAAGIFTVREETVDDARAAVALAARQPEIDGRRIFVLGHSLGGTLAPRIAANAASPASDPPAPRVAGIVLMGGGTRTLQRTIVEQLEHIASLDPQGPNAAEMSRMIDKARLAARAIDSPDLTPTSKVDVLGASIPGSYFLDLRDYHPAEAAARLGIPILVLQAGRDYQSNATDLAGWRQALGTDPRATFHDYPGLYHLFMPSSTPGTGLGSPADYSTPGHVVEAVVRDVAAWIAAVPAPAPARGGRS